MYKRKNYIFERQIILSAIATDALRHLAETLKESGWTKIEISSLGLTAEYTEWGQHVIVITCLPHTQFDTELLITISSTIASDVDYDSLNVVKMLNSLGDVRNPLSGTQL